MKFLGRYSWMFNMPRSKQRLAQLSRVLGGLPQDTLPMTVTEFDGFVTGILITPVHVTPSEWLPYVWGQTRDAQFPNQRIAEATTDALLAHFDVVASELAAMTDVQPIYSESNIGGLFFWEPWVDGFMQAVELRRLEWQVFIERADEDVQTTFSFLQSLHDVYTGKSELLGAQIEEIDAVACDVIPSCISMIAKRSRPDRCFPQPANVQSKTTCQSPG